MYDRKSQLKYYYANKEKRQANVARWRAENPERQKELFRRYRNGLKGYATKMWHQHIEEGAHPAARTSYGQEGVAELYAEARRQGLTIDHIDPLKHALICGLHNRFNLQILSRSENSRKGGRWASREEVFR